MPKLPSGGGDATASVFPMILVTGATGTIGSVLVRLLAERGEPVRAMTRNPSGGNLPPGVEVVYGDFDKPASLEQAVAGASALFLLTAPGAAVGDHDTAMLEVARQAGVASAVKLSAIATGEIGPDGKVIGSWHIPGEQALQASGMAWTLLRPTSFASNTLSWAASISNGVPITNLTGTGRQGVIDPRDVAAVAAEVLTSAEHDGQTYTLTGPELLSVPDQVARLAQVLGHAIETVDVPLEEALQFLLASGMSQTFANGVVSGSAFVVVGRNAVVTDDVERILGHAPGSYQTWAQYHRAAFTAQPG